MFSSGMGEGFTLIEVKSSSEAKEQHIPDVAIQTWVLRQAGLQVNRVEVMHLNKEYRHPGGDAPLFARTDVTAEVDGFLPQVPDLVASLSSMLEGPLPDTPIGLQCFEPYKCVFKRAVLACRPRPYRHPVQQRPQEDRGVHGQGGAQHLGYPGRGPNFRMRPSASSGP